MYYDFNAFLDAAAADPRIMTMAQSYFGDPKFIYEAAIRNPQLFAFARPELLNYPDLVFAIGENSRELSGILDTDLDKTHLFY